MGILPKRKKGGFKFRLRTVPVLWVVPDTGMLVRKEMEIWVLGCWGYHCNLFKATKRVSIIHVPSGYLIHKTKTVKQAKILCKKLHTKTKNKWEPMSEELLLFAKFYKEVSENLKKFSCRRTKFVYKTEGFKIKDIENDIPF